MIEWQALKRHELSADYHDLSGPAWDSFLEGMVEGGFDAHYPIVIYAGEVIDGWQRQRAAVQLGIEPVYRTLPDGVDLEAFVKRVNDDRRHESSEAKAKRIAERRERVAKARSEGKSYREIAEEEGVDEKTARNDVKAVEEESGADMSAGETIGRDGKTYPAKQPPAQPAVDTSAQREIEILPVGEPKDGVLNVEFAEPQQFNDGDSITINATYSAPPEPSRNKDEFTKQNPKIKVTASKQNFVDAPEPDQMADDDDYPIPAKLRSAFAICDDLRGVEYRLNRIATDLANIEQSVAYKLAAATSPDKMAYSTLLLTAAKKIRDLCPSVVHQDCKGEGCSRCNSKGFLTNSEAGHEDES